jgi:hypothetical protein
MAHACNPTHSEGRDQEDQGLKPAWAKKQKKQLKRLSKIPTQKGLGGSDSSGTEHNKNMKVDPFT